MTRRPLGRTGLTLPTISFGAAPIGQEFCNVDLNEATRAVRTAIDLGVNFLDTSPYYGRGFSECLLGVALRGVPRDSYLLGTKLGRYAPARFDFSARRVAESVDVSLQRMGVEYLDVMLCHDIEFVDMAQVVEETLPALRKVQKAGKVRFVGVSGYPMKLFKYVLDQTELDVVLSYNHYTLQNTMLAGLISYLQSKNVGILNAAPFSARLLTNAPLPPWHKATAEVRETCRRAAEHCTSRGVDIAQLALQFAVANPDLSTCVVGLATPEEVEKAAAWAELPIDEGLRDEVLAILRPIHDWFYVEGLPANNDDRPGAAHP